MDLFYLYERRILVIIRLNIQLSKHVKLKLMLNIRIKYAILLNASINKEIIICNNKNVITFANISIGEHRNLIINVNIEYTKLIYLIVQAYSYI